jgi:hypothetical protein
MAVLPAVRGLSSCPLTLLTHNQLAAAGTDWKVERQQQLFLEGALAADGSVGSNPMAGEGQLLQLLMLHRDDRARDKDVCSVSCKSF